MDPTNAMIEQKRNEFQLFNPHLTHIRLPGCERVLLLRLMQELTSTLFTRSSSLPCDGLRRAREVTRLAESD